MLVASAFSFAAQFHTGTLARNVTHPRAARARAPVLLLQTVQLLCYQSPVDSMCRRVPAAPSGVGSRGHSCRARVELDEPLSMSGGGCGDLGFAITSRVHPAQPVSCAACSAMVFEVTQRLGDRGNGVVLVPSQRSEWLANNHPPCPHSGWVRGACLLLQSPCRACWWRPVVHPCAYAGRWNFTEGLELGHRSDPPRAEPGRSRSAGYRGRSVDLGEGGVWGQVVVAGAVGTATVEGHPHGLVDRRKGSCWGLLAPLAAGAIQLVCATAGLGLFFQAAPPPRGLLRPYESL